MAVTDQPFTAVVSAAGTAVISFKPPTHRASYIVQQVSVEYPTAPLACTCTVRKNGRFITFLIPTGDVADGNPPVPLNGGSDILTINFASATPGEIVNAFIIYDDGSPV